MREVLSRYRKTIFQKREFLLRLCRNILQVADIRIFPSMGQLAIVNAPSTFTAIWNVMKPWMSKETRAKVDILGSDYKDVLLNLIDAENLPSTLGGNCTCEEAGGCELSGAGPWMDGRIGWGPKAQARREAEAKVNGDADSASSNQDGGSGGEV